MGRLPQASEFIGDPLHEIPAGPHKWSRVAFAEALPGVPTPLTWDFWRTASEGSGRRICHDIGLLTRGEIEPPTDASARLTAIAYGRPVANAGSFRAILDRAPGDAGAAFERHLMGEAEPSVRGAARSRSLAMAVRLSQLVALAPGRIARAGAATDAWWRDAVRRAGTGDAVELKAIIADAFARCGDIFAHSGFGTFLSQLLFAQVEAALPRERHDLLSGVGAGKTTVAGLDVLDALRRVALGQDTKAALIERFGYHASHDGEAVSPAWREAPEMLDPTIAALRRGANIGAAAPASRARADAGAILKSVPASKRLGVRIALSLIPRCSAWRQQGKAASLKATDVLRAGARAFGRHLAQRDHIEEPDDVFFLIGAELAQAPFDGMRETIAFRRARRALYSRLEIPSAFRGVPEPVRGSARHPSAHAADEGASSLNGLGVSPGVVEGTARVVLDPAQVRSFRRGDILVCVSTQPSWIALMSLAGGIACDIGGMLSHGAVIAREIGVPCVVNTGNGSAAIPDGARVRLDGRNGTVDILEGFGE